MTNLKPGAVVLVNFPFTDLRSSKVRPALILTTKKEDAVILGIFSRVPDELHESWIVIDESHPAFNQTGLKKASITVVHRFLIRREIGNIPSDDAAFLNTSY